MEMSPSPPQKVKQLPTITTTTIRPEQQQQQRRPRLALALDTRLVVVQDNDRDAAVDTARVLHQTLWQDLATTGVLPDTIVTTGTTKQEKEQSPNNNNPKIVLECHARPTIPQLVDGTVQMPPIVFTLQDNHKEVPKPLLAKNTWKVVCGMGKTTNKK